MFTGSVLPTVVHHWQNLVNYLFIFFSKLVPFANSINTATPCMFWAIIEWLTEHRRDNSLTYGTSHYKRKLGSSMEHYMCECVCMYACVCVCVQTVCLFFTYLNMFILSFLIYCPHVSTGCTIGYSHLNKFLFWITETGNIKIMYEYDYKIPHKKIKQLEILKQGISLVIIVT